MKPVFLTNVLVILAIAMVVAGCLGMPTPLSTSQEMVDLAFTMAAQTIVAEWTLTAPVASATFELSLLTSTLVPTNIPTPSNTPIPTEIFPPTSFPSSSETAVIQATQEQGLILEFEDDFQLHRGWVVQSGVEYDMRYVEGGYAILVSIPHGTIWSVRSPEYADVRLETTVSRNQGPEDGYYGVVCRHVNGSNYYYLVASPGGFYGIGKMSKGQSTWLDRGEDPSGTLLTGSNDLIRGDCIGDTLTLYANAKILLQVQDTEFKTGEWGLAGGTRTGDGFEALFTKFNLYLPK